MFSSGTIELYVYVCTMAVLLLCTFDDPPSVAVTAAVLPIALHASRYLTLMYCVQSYTCLALHIQHCIYSQPVLIIQTYVIVSTPLAGHQRVP